MRNKTIGVCGVLILGLWMPLWSSPANAVPFFSSGDRFDTSISISNEIVATRFSVPTFSTLTLGSATILVKDTFNTTDLSLNIDGSLGNFGGAIGWGIYAAEGFNVGTLLASGQDTLANVVDTGIDTGGTYQSDIFALTFDFETPTFGSVTDLTSGLYFLAVHEGLWLSGNDGSAVEWFDAQDGSTRRSTDLTNPSFVFGSLSGQAFDLSALTTPPPPQPIPEPSSVFLFTTGTLGLIAYGRKKRWLTARN